MTCDNKVEQQIACGPYGMDSKTIISKCGTTGNDGETLVCDECEKNGVTRNVYATRPAEFDADGYEIDSPYDY